MAADAYFERERRAGYDPELVHGSTLLLVGCGAVGSNLALSAGLSGVGTTLVADFDRASPTNLTRAPLLTRSSVRRYKVVELSRNLRRFAYAPEPRIGYAIARGEEIGLGVYARATDVASAVDSLGSRAFIADACRLVGRPFIETGVRPPWARITVFPNCSADEPCWRCLVPDATYGGVSCALYAQSTVAAGGLPATQTTAAVAANYAAEAVLQAVHGRFPLGNMALNVNIATGVVRQVSVTRDPNCPGVHRVLPQPRPLMVSADAPLSVLFDALRAKFSDPVIRLPLPVVASTPCVRCGREVSVGQVAALIQNPPRCRRCPNGRNGVGAVPVVVHELDSKSPLVELPCRRVGLPPLAWIEVTDRASGHTEVVELVGDLADVFTFVAPFARRGQRP